MVIDQNEANTISESIAFGWDSGKARALEALKPYVRHLGDCGAVESSDPRAAGCSCGLRSVWRIRETPEVTP